LLSVGRCCGRGDFLTHTVLSQNALTLVRTIVRW
jgi:hypothetical protein